MENTPCNAQSGRTAGAERGGADTDTGYWQGFDGQAAGRGATVKIRHGDGVGAWLVDDDSEACFVVRPFVF